MSDGTIERAAVRVTFRYERRLRHPIEEVWKAITDPAEIGAWAGTRPELDLEPGGRYVTHHGSGHTVVDRIVRVEPPTLFEHTFWVDVNPSGLVTWELSPTEDGCLLVLTHSLDLDDVRRGASTVALGDSESVIVARNGAGWHRLLDLLQARLDGRTTAWSSEMQQALRERYAAKLL